MLWCLLFSAGGWSGIYGPVEANLAAEILKAAVKSSYDIYAPYRSATAWLVKAGTRVVLLYFFFVVVSDGVFILSSPRPSTTETNDTEDVGSEYGARNICLLQYNVYFCLCLMTEPGGLVLKSTRYWEGRKRAVYGS